MTPFLIDTDPGIDDALALLFAWNSPEIQVGRSWPPAPRGPLLGR